MTTRDKDSSVLTDDLIAQLLKLAEYFDHYQEDSYDIEANLLRKAAEALAAASRRPQEQEIESLRQLCAEVYQVAGTLGTDTRVLDNLWAATQGQPLPHTTVLPYTSAPSAAPPPWQPIETLHVGKRDTELFFWCVPKTAEETYRNSSGEPIVSTAAPYLHRGRYKSWGSLSKATHWLPLPPAPTESK
jgi:hypothetical protein